MGDEHENHVRKNKRVQPGHWAMEHKQSDDYERHGQSPWTRSSKLQPEHWAVEHKQSDEHARHIRRSKGVQAGHWAVEHKQSDEHEKPISSLACLTSPFVGFLNLSGSEMPRHWHF